MNNTRRQLLASGGLLGALLSLGIFPARAAELQAAFDAKSLADVLAALGAKPADSADIALTSPDIAENGAVVPVTVDSKVPGTKAIYIIVEKNPNPLSASFTIPEGTDAFVQTRVKMGETSRIVALVQAGDKVYSASRETKVTLGGCGG